MMQVRLKDLVHINSTVLDESTAPDLRFRYVDIGSVSEGSIRVPEEEVTFGSAPSRARRLAEPGDTIVSTVRTYLRAVARVPRIEGALVFSTGFAILHPTDRVDSRFLTYYCQSGPFVDEVVARSVGVSYPAINATELGTFRLALPALDDQRRIADFLDAETARIDHQMRLRGGMVDLLNERVEWLVGCRIAASPLGSQCGDFPVVPVKRVLTRLTRKGKREADVITAFRDGQVTARALRRAEGYTESWMEGASVQEVRRGDVVIHGLDGFAGAVGVAEADGVCSPAYHVCTPQNGGDPDYLGRLIRMLALTGYLSVFGGSARERAVDFRNWASFGRILVPQVPPEEQREVGDMIRSIRPVRTAVDQAAALMGEYRLAIVTGAVAGQFDVTTAQGAA